MSATGWAPPPVRARGNTERRVWQEELKSRPGEWGWRTYKTAGSGSVVGTAMRRLGFETAWRGAEKRLYARWPMERGLEEPDGVVAPPPGGVGSK